MYEIQADVPVPPIDYRPKGRRKYPFEEMQVGDMIFVPGKTNNAIAAHVSKVAKKLGHKFTVRRSWMHKVKGKWQPCVPQDTGATDGVGIWRVE